MNVHYTTIKDIASEIYSHPMMRDIPMERIIRDTLELIQIVGCPALFEEKEAVIHINNNKGELPCDYYDINQVFLLENNKKIIVEEILTMPKIEGSVEIVPNTNSITNVHTNPTIPTNDTNYRQEDTPKFTQGLKSFVYSTDTLAPRGKQLTYKMQGNIIYTSIPSGSILMSYRAIKLDKEGYPLIIRNASFIRALKSYIKMNWFTILFETNGLHPTVLDNAQKDYAFNVAQATNSLIKPTLDQMESLSRIMNAPLISQSGHSTGFQYLNNNTKMKIH